MRVPPKIVLMMLLATPLAVPAYLEVVLWEKFSCELIALYQQGKYQEAEIVAKYVLKMAEENFGPDHPYVAACLNHLAELYRAQGQYAKADSLYKRALAIYEKPVAVIEGL